MATFVVKRKSSGIGWRLLQQKYFQGKRSEVEVPGSAFALLGFIAEMGVAEARQRANQLNAAKSVEKHQAVNAARRVTVDMPLVQSGFLPPDLVHQFTTWLRNNSNGSTQHVSKLIVHWFLVQKLIAEICIQPTEYIDNSKLIYKLFSSRKYSLDYSCKLLRILNQWGAFCGRKHGHYYEAIKTPAGQSRQQIEEAYEDSRYYRAGGSTPLTPVLLGKLTGKLPQQEHNWLAVSLWFGLRPSEVMGKHELKQNALMVYQSKLVSLPKPKRWKQIDFVTPEQWALVPILAAKDLKRPLAKTIKKHLDAPKISLYAGRKGFGDLMEHRGHDIYKVSRWLGHQSLKQTWGRYTNIVK